MSDARSGSRAGLGSGTPHTAYDIAESGHHRRRRTRHRRSWSGAELRATTTGSSYLASLHPGVDVIGPRLPSRRKTASSARSGSVMSLLPVPKETLYIQMVDLFGTGPVEVCRDTLESVSEGDEQSMDEPVSQAICSLVEQLDQDDGPVTPCSQRRAQYRESIAQRTGRKLNVAKRPFDPSQCTSLIMYARERDNACRLRYLPLGAAPPDSWKEPSKHDTTSFQILPECRQRLELASIGSTPTRPLWPPREVPVEIFDMITEHLSRDDIKSMRLVGKEFERKVSCALFNTSVVPFNTELYDMIDEDTKAGIRSSYTYSSPSENEKRTDGTGQDSIADKSSGGLFWQNAKEDIGGKVYKGHGLRVFKGFGPHIKRFGMSFEVAEDQLTQIPIKQELDQVESYHGPYHWPQNRYTRFANLAGLERTADETLRMKAAFANLQNVQDLGLSIDSGLGWLNGPDISSRARVFQRPSAIFGQSRPDRNMEEAENFWAAIQASHESFGTTDLRETTLVRRTLEANILDLYGLKDTAYSEMALWPQISASNVKSLLSRPGEQSAKKEDPFDGVYFTTCSHADFSNECMYDKSALVPSLLRKEQKEWLLETEWAQRAFLESYMLAIIDNIPLSMNIKSLTVAKLSSGLLASLSQDAFWDALPCLGILSVHVEADWRTIERDHAGFAQSRPLNPSDAVQIYYDALLRDRICPKSSIKELTIGWSGGGEHAEGIFARNAHILPAPITPLEQSVAASITDILEFSFVEHLTLNNCWLTPPVLESLVRTHADKQLKTLTLNSVSMSAHPKFTFGPAHLGVPALVAHAQQQLFQAWQQQIATQHNGPLIAPNHPANLHGIPPLQQPGHGNGPMPANINQHPGQTRQPNHWTKGHRDGSWPQVLNEISPGTIFSDFLPEPAPREEQLPLREKSTLLSIELISCGYVKLCNNIWFDQSILDTGREPHLSMWFRTRQTGLTPAMMTTHDRFLGRVMQHMPRRELDAMFFAWQMYEGWRDVAKAEEVRYDGLLSGGTGRFSGRISNAD